MIDRFKFNAWHKKQNKMIYDIHKTTIIHHAMSGSGGEPLSFENYLDPEWFDILQCTTYKDKNGKLIYEGDIVKHEYQKGVWSIAWTNMTYSDKHLFHPMGSGGEAMEAYYGNWDEEEFEVIGNIYQDSHLLENHENL